MPMHKQEWFVSYNLFITQNNAYTYHTPYKQNNRYAVFSYQQCLSMHRQSSLTFTVHHPSNKLNKHSWWMYLESHTQIHFSYNLKEITSRYKTDPTWLLLRSAKTNLRIIFHKYLDTVSVLHSKWNGPLAEDFDSSVTGVNQNVGGALTGCLMPLIQSEASVASRAGVSGGGTCHEHPSLSVYIGRARECDSGSLWLK